MIVYIFFKVEVGLSLIELFVIYVRCLLRYCIRDFYLFFSKFVIFLDESKFDKGKKKNVFLKFIF